MDRVCSQYGGARMQESYRPTGAKSAQMAGAALRGVRAIMFADDCRYGCREATTTGQKHEIESTLITSANGDKLGVLPSRNHIRSGVLGRRIRLKTNPPTALGCGETPRWPEPKPQSSSGNYVRGGICSRCRFVWSGSRNDRRPFY
jgi:hypothetical protein